MVVVMGDVFNKSCKAASSRRSFIGLATGLMVTGVNAASAVRPNILMIVSDDLGWNDVGFRNLAIRTPNLNCLAGNGVRLDQYRTMSICSPTRASLLTGRSAFRLGVPAAIPATDALPASERLLPQMLSAAGYQTALIGKWHLGTITPEYLPHRRGFDLHYGFLGGQTSYFTHQGAGNRVDWYRNGIIVNEEGYTTDLLAAESIRFIKERDRERPFFLDLSLNAPHTPLEAQEDFLAKYSNIEDPDRRKFTAMVDAMDAAIGKVIGVLKDEGIADNTLILWMSDNGGQATMNGGGSNEPLRGRKGGAYDGGLRVPALAVWPGVLPPGRVHNRLFTVVDWLPTLAEAAGFETGSIEFDGVSLWKDLLGGEGVERGAVVLGGGNSSAVFSGEYKFVEQTMGQTTAQSLFRIYEDPNEEKDVKAQYPEVASELLAILRAHPRGIADKAR